MSKIYETLTQIKKGQFTSEEKEIFKNLENYRQQLGESEEIIDYSVFGYDERKMVKDTVHRAGSPKIWCQFHYLLTKNLRAKTYLEIGTNLGVSGSYILSALKEHDDSYFVTMEGAPKLCEIAENQFRKIVEPKQFKIFNGLYKDTFPELLQLPLLFDMSFIDGNHRYEPTLYYFRSLKKKLSETTVFIFDDIYLNDEMVKAWREIKNDKEVNYTVDLFKLGIAVIDKNDAKHNIHFTDYLQ